MFFKALERAERDLAWRRRATPSEGRPDRTPSSSAPTRLGLERLKLRYDYSKFQIGLYTTLAVVFAVAIALPPEVFRLQRGVLGLAAAFVGLAGLAAGIIAGHCAHFASSEDLLAARIGPFRWACMTGEYWSYLQHASFVAAVGLAALSLFMGEGSGSPRSARLRTPLYQSERSYQEPYAERGQEYQHRPAERALVEPVLKLEAESETRQPGRSQP